MGAESVEIRSRPISRRTESLRSDGLNIEIKMGGSSVCGEMELDDNPIIAIESIQAHGINASDIARLRAHGVFTVYELLRRMRKDLEKIKGFSEVKVEKIKEAGKKMMPNFNSFITATEHGQQRRRCVRISTGSKQLDGILNGGFETQSISEVYGEFRCGKTQLGHTMAVIAQLPRDMGGAEGKVAYIGEEVSNPTFTLPLRKPDTEGTFRPERIADIAARFGVDPEQTCENISFARCMNSEHQYELLDSLAPSFATGEYKLLVIDSVMGCFRTDYQGRGELSERQQKLGQYLDKVKAMAEQFNLAVLMTNQVQSDPGASALFASADGRKPVGGHVLAHASTTRILLRKGRGEERVAKVIDSPDCAEREATYIITTGGINDPERA